MNKEQKNRIKEEFLEWCKEDPALELANGVGSFENIADWFLPKIAELLKSQRDEERLRSAKIVEELMVVCVLNMLAYCLLYQLK